MFITRAINKDLLATIVQSTFLEFGNLTSSSLLDSLKYLGFSYATSAGISINIEDLKRYKISNVFLPEHLNTEQKKEISTLKKSVYTSPDLYLEITDGINIYFESVELKSTKDNNIPGSSVQQISPFEWVIFIKRDNEKVL